MSEDIKFDWFLTLLQKPSDAGVLPEFLPRYNWEKFYSGFRYIFIFAKIQLEGILFWPDDTFLCLLRYNWEEFAF